MTRVGGMRTMICSTATARRAGMEGERDNGMVGLTDTPHALCRFHTRRAVADSAAMITNDYGRQEQLRFPLSSAETEECSHFATPTAINSVRRYS